MSFDFFDTDDRAAILDFIYWYDVATRSSLEYEFMISFLNSYENEHDIYDSIAEAVCDWDLA
tara:strand:- start:393 stop:578 length:186 start_codon:yes stop_codon:yes gene_type:complete